MRAGLKNPPTVGLFFDFNAHATGSSCDNVERCVLVASVEILELGLYDLLDLIGGHFAHLLLVGHFGSRGNSSRFFEENGGGGDLVMKVKDLS